MAKIRPTIVDPRTLSRAAAIASLREGWRLAKESGLDKITDEEIDAEIALVREKLLLRRKSPSGF